MASFRDRTDRGPSLWQEAKNRSIPIGDLPQLFDEAATRQVLRFWETWAERGGFFSRQDLGRIFERHLIESLFLLRSAFAIYERLSGQSVSHETKIADVGSGPGVPGALIPCWKAASLRATLIDSSRRRLGRVEDELCTVPLFQERLDFRYGRTEEMRGEFDLVLSRAFLPFPIAAECVTRLLRRGGFYLMLVGADPLSPMLRDDRLRNNLKIYLKNCGLVSRETESVPELSFLGERHIVVLRKTADPLRGYPRSWKRIKESQSQWKKSSH